jgi:hypothetical protein
MRKEQNHNNRKDALAYLAERSDYGRDDFMPSERYADHLKLTKQMRKETWITVAEIGINDPEISKRIADKLRRDERLTDREYNILFESQMDEFLEPD